jgi:eRF1 domain 2
MLLLGRLAQATPFLKWSKPVRVWHLRVGVLIRYGFIVMDGNGSLFGTLSGNTREVLHKFTVELPKKHGRGGQSALRFARLRMEKRHNYVRKVIVMRARAYACCLARARSVTAFQV